MSSPNPPTIVIVRESPTVIEVSSSGPQGPEGPEGPAGDSDVAFSESFTNLPSLVVTHNLGYKPRVSIVVSGEDIFGVDVIHVSVNQLNVSWNTPLTGEVWCS